MPLLGHLALWVALLAGVWGAAMGFAAERLRRADLAESARRAGTALAVALIVALMALVVALLRQDFNVAYVTAYTDRALPQIYRWAAIYAGPEGQLIVWATFIALFGAVVESRPSFNGAVGAIVSVAVGILLVAQNPFAHLAYTPVDGRGLAPVLQDVGFLVYPPLLYLAFAAAVIPACFAASALVTRQTESQARSWIVVSWILLTLAIGVGLWWSYQRLGFDSSWVWDPVQSQSLPAWLVLTALLVSSARGSWSRFWRVNAWLMLFAASLAAWGMFVTSAFRVALAMTLGTTLVCTLMLVASWPRRRSSWGLGLAFAGTGLVIVGLALQRLTTRVEPSLRPGETISLKALGNRTITFSYLAASHYPVRNTIVTRALIEVRSGTHLVGRVGPQRLQFVDVFGRDRFEPVSRADALNRPFESVYAALVAVSAGDDRATLRVAVNPLVWLVWLGTALAAAGGVVTLVTGRREP